MDRREFLTTTAVAATGAAVGGTEPALAAPALARGGSTLRLAVSSALADCPAVTGIRHLAQRIGAASGGRIALEIECGHGAPFTALTSGSADAAFGYVHDDMARAPALGWIGGLPGRQGLAAAALQSWLTAGGGQMLWDDVGFGLGYKPLLAGHTGPAPGLWLDRADGPWTRPLAVSGLGGAVVNALGGCGVAMQAGDIAAAIAGGAIGGAELDALPVMAALGLAAHGRTVSTPGLHAHGRSMMLGVALPAWERLQEGERILLEALAAEATQAALAERAASVDLVRGALAARFQIGFAAMDAELVARIDAVAADIVADAVATSREARRMRDSHDGFVALTAAAQPVA